MRPFPWHAVPPSAAVDLLGLAAGRSAIRVRLESDVEAARLWAADHELSLLHDGEFAVLATSTALAERVMAVDRSTVPHAMELGGLLGYPTCCSSAVAEVGEGGIDQLARQATGWCLDGVQMLLDISRYSMGIALLSHVPCGPSCAASLRQARKGLRAAQASHVDEELNARWHAIATHFARVGLDIIEII